MTELEGEKKKQEEEKKEKLNKIKAKVMTIARFNRMLKNSKDNAEYLAKIKKNSADGKLPMGLLIKSQDEIKDDVNMFLALKKIDSDNEKFPIVAFKRRESEKLTKKK